MNHQSVREAICEVGHHLWTLGFVAANDGNISVKLEDGTFLTTPTGISKRALKPHMLLHMNANNEVIERHPEYLPSSEFKMHLRCYKERPILTLWHAHPLPQRVLRWRIYRWTSTQCRKPLCFWLAPTPVCNARNG